MKIVAAIDQDCVRRQLSLAAESASAEVAFVPQVSVRHLAEFDAAFLEWREEESAEPLLEALRASPRLERPTRMVVLVPRGAHKLFRRAVAAGAWDVLYSPPEDGELEAELEELAAGSGELLDPEARQEFEKMRETSLVGVSAPFMACLERVRKAARSDANVLLVGPTGSGKDAMANAIHTLGRRRAEKFNAVNCANLDGQLALSELFGHVKGAFTGAEKNTDGWFTAVGAGTLFLDEIGDLDLATQVKLLRAIEQRTFNRLGDTAELHFHGRFVCATLKNLNEAVREGRFREDLLARIDQYRIEVPPLRERPGDLGLLLWRFVEKHSRGKRVEFSESAMAAVESYDYPKNVRELESAVQTAITNMGNRAVVLPQDLPRAVLLGPTVERVAPECTIDIPAGVPYKEAREAAVILLDGVYLNRLLGAHGGNQTAAAEAAGIDRKTFGERLARARGGQTA
jgi:DNA-binding NtrC family response regulator